jgi:hypothetical protein
VAVDAKTIQIYLPDGEPRGLRIAEITTRLVQAIQLPRTKLERFFNRQESQQIGLYFLFGDREDSIKPLVYIGQTEDLVARLKNHHANKEFWRSTVAIVSRTQSFTQAHLRYLEWLSIRSTIDAGRYALDNGNEGGKPYVPEPMEADVLDAFETAGILLTTLGFPVFDPPVRQSDAKVIKHFYCKGPHGDGKGALVEDGFVVFANSLVRRHPVPSAKQFVPWLDKLRESGVLLPINDDQCRLTQDFVANSPSYAAALPLARHANGWQEWIDAEGNTLHDIYRAETEGE